MFKALKIYLWIIIFLQMFKKKKSALFIFKIGEDFTIDD
jgi:hypothetical protein